MDDLLLKNPHCAGAYTLNRAHQDRVRHAAKKLGFVTKTADLAAATSIPDSLERLGRALQLPDWYGGNFDALVDCLSDPDWQPAKGHVLFINGAAHLHEADPDGFATLIDVFQTIAANRGEQEQPFWLLLDTQAPGIPTFPQA